MSKQQLIDSIQRFNPSAQREFLTDFNKEELDRYLNHLRFTQMPRGANHEWIRRADSPAVVVRTA
ncbi:MAG: hypothetical protein ACYTGQ_03740 [Planctomycetota bacterium]|jgi:hypothetical protein